MTPPPSARRRAALALALLLLTLLAAARPARAQAATDSAAIHQRARDFSAAYVRGDVDAMLEAYTPDAVIFPDRAEMLTGADALRRYWTLRPGSRITRHVSTPTRIQVVGNTAYDYGVYEVAGERDGVPWGPVLGKYVIVWRREPGGPWRMQLDIWNRRPDPPSP